MSTTTHQFSDGVDSIGYLNTGSGVYTALNGESIYIAIYVELREDNIYSISDNWSSDIWKYQGTTLEIDPEERFFKDDLSLTASSSGFECTRDTITAFDFRFTELNTTFDFESYWFPVNGWNSITESKPWSFNCNSGDCDQCMVTVEYSQQPDQGSIVQSQELVPEHTLVPRFDGSIVYEFQTDEFKESKFTLTASPSLNLMSQEFLQPLYASQESLINVGPTWFFPNCAGACTLPCENSCNGQFIQDYFYQISGSCYQYIGGEECQCSPNVADTTLFRQLAACPVLDDICTAQEELSINEADTPELRIEGHLNPLTILDLSSRISNPGQLSLTYEIIVFDPFTQMYEPLPEEISQVFTNQNARIQINLEGDEEFGLTTFALRVSSTSCIEEYEDALLYNYPEINIEFRIEAYHCDGQVVSPIQAGAFSIIYGEGQGVIPVLSFEAITLGTFQVQDETKCPIQEYEFLLADSVTPLNSDTDPTLFAALMEPSNEAPEINVNTILSELIRAVGTDPVYTFYIRAKAEGGNVGFKQFRIEIHICGSEVLTAVNPSLSYTIQVLPNQDIVLDVEPLVVTSNQYCPPDTYLLRSTNGNPQLSQVLTPLQADNFILTERSLRLTPEHSGEYTFYLLAITYGEVYVYVEFTVDIVCVFNSQSVSTVSAVQDFLFDKNQGLQNVLTINEIRNLFSVSDSSTTRCPIETYEVIESDQSVINSNDRLYSLLNLVARPNDNSDVDI